ncbi:MAG: hypothetical protein QXN32_03965 [Candidatus Nitrosocaldus sp.]
MLTVRAKYAMFEVNLVLCSDDADADADADAEDDPSLAYAAVSMLDIGASNMMVSSSSDAKHTAG